jgi:hypothetical protein
MILLIKLSTAAALAANRGGFIEPGEASPEFQKLVIVMILLAIIVSAIFTILDIKRDKKRFN